jgi:hypothetical protein
MAISEAEQKIIDDWLSRLKYQMSLMKHISEDLMRFSRGEPMSALPQDLIKLVSGGNLVRYVKEEDLKIELLSNLMFDGFWIKDAPDLSQYDYSMAEFAVMRGVLTLAGTHMEPHVIQGDRLHMLTAAEYLPSQSAVAESGGETTPLLYVIKHNEAAVNAYLDLLRWHINRIEQFSIDAYDELVQGYVEENYPAGGEENELQFFTNMLIRASFLNSEYAMGNLTDCGIGYEDQAVIGIWYRDSERTLEEEQDMVRNLLLTWVNTKE